MNSKTSLLTVFKENFIIRLKQFDSGAAFYFSPNGVGF